MEESKYCEPCGSVDHMEVDHFKSIQICEDERPPRKVICQKEKDHPGSCKAVIFWEKGLP